MLFRMCIHAPNLDVDPLDAIELKELADSGLVNVRFYGGEKNTKETFLRYILFEFDITETDKIGDIHAITSKFKPAYCFNDVCPRTNHACPAWRPQE